MIFEQHHLLRCDEAEINIITFNMTLIKMAEERAQNV